MRECWDLPACEADFLAEPLPEVQDRPRSAGDLKLLSDPHSFCFEEEGEALPRDEVDPGSNVIPFPRRAAAPRERGGDRR